MIKKPLSCIFFFELLLVALGLELGPNSYFPRTGNIARNTFRTCLYGNNCPRTSNDPRSELLDARFLHWFAAKSERATRPGHGFKAEDNTKRRKIESILGDLPGVQVYLDDILVTEKKGDSTLRQVLLRLRDYGGRLNNEKCKFRQKESVWFRKYSPGEKWSPGVLKSTSGSRLVEAQSPDGANIHRRHADQLRPRDSGDKAPGTSVPPPGTPGSSPTGRPHYRASGDPAARTTSATPGPAEPTPFSPVTTTSAPSEPVPASGGAPAAAGSTPRRSSRTRRPPSRLVYKDRVQGSE
uniref:Putative secreted protein n=1 Tax=Ixodes scapularis TaxID=6945 RepID=A0A4D5RZP1_IXOSC